MSLHIGLKAELVSASPTSGYLAGGPGGIDRVYPLVIPQKKKGGAAQVPCVVFSLATPDRQVTYCGTQPLVRTLVTLDLYAIEYDEVVLLAAAVRSVLNDFRGMLGAIVEVRTANIQSEIDLSDIEPGLYRVQQTWAIWHLE